MTPNREYILTLLDRTFSQKNKSAGEIHQELNNFFKNNTEKQLKKISDDDYLIALEEFNENVLEDFIDFYDDFLSQDDND